MKTLNPGYVVENRVSSGVEDVIRKHIWRERQNNMELWDVMMVISK
ncbi:MAG: hypothetical protein K6G60_07970 [Lachnospiraceae bacterium]|nr:hypothetical protein [Lachnospiraceae bacterium]